MDGRARHSAEETMFTWFNVVQIVQQAHENILVMLATVETLAITTAESLAESAVETLAGLTTERLAESTTETLAESAAESVEMFADGSSPADWDYVADPFADF